MVTTTGVGTETGVLVSKTRGLPFDVSDFASDRTGEVLAIRAEG